MRGYIRKRGENRYQVEISGGRDPQTGKRVRKYIQVQGSYKDAQKVLTDTLHQVNSGMPLVAPQKGRVTVDEYFRGWLDGWAPTHVRPTTFESYKMIIEKHVLPVLGRLRLDKLQPEHLEKLYADKLKQGGLRRAGSGLSPRTVQYMHARIKQVLDRAVGRGLISRNVAELVDPPLQEEKEMKTLTATEVQTFLAAMRTDHYYALWRLALGTGMRRGELLGLRWSDVDFERKSLTIRQQIVPVEGRPTIQEPKTAKSKRTIPLSDDMIGALREHRLKQTEERLLAEQYGNLDLVFAGRTGQPISPRGMERRLHHRLRKLGLRLIRFHDLRHTFATVALEAGVPLKVVSETLGHEKISTTGDRYQHVQMNVQEKYIAMVSDLMKPRSREQGERS